ncbi:malic enzyme-like NAD(P)-binding protein [Nocardia sp. NBC_00403]|uniref:malic enzyme-like NAD(P)-binding protein n=1 Tax=Nocardia sp. NBC_00403 TaxID=2975990 RepID=UPI003FA5AC34
MVLGGKLITLLFECVNPQTAEFAGRAPLTEHRIVLLGGSTAGFGIADQLRGVVTVDGHGRDQARSRFWCIDRYGPLTEGMPGFRGLPGPLRSPCRRGSRMGLVRNRIRRRPGRGSTRVQPTVLIGTATEHGAFPEAIVRDMPLPRDVLPTVPPGRTGSPPEFVVCRLFKGNRRELR